MDLDVVLLSRIQFAVTIMFHYLFVPLSIGLGLLLVMMEGMYLKTGNPLYESMTKFWVKIFGLTFGLGVATGIVMEFQFGTNWATYSRFVGDVFGSALAAEGIFAFFLESGFLAILVFGWDKVSKKMHFFSTCMVCLGSMFSAVWIVVANSWQQTPAGFHLVGIDEMGVKKIFETPMEFDPATLDAMQIRAEITNFWELLFNPSSVIRLIHVLLGAYILASFFVMSVTAYYVVKRRHSEFAHRSFILALLLAAAASILQLVAGHFSGEVVAKHQPAKMAGFEGIYETRESTPLYAFGWVDDEAETVRFGLEVPAMLSFLVHRDFKTPVAGFDTLGEDGGELPWEDRPPVQMVFQSYHLMIAMGMYFIAITFLALFLHWKGVLFEKRWLMWVFVFSVAAPYVANQTGWMSAELGRQPWVVYGLLRTGNAFSKAVDAPSVLASLVLFTMVYLLLFALFLFILDRKIKDGPEDPERIHEPAPGERDLLEAITRRGKAAYGMLDTGESDSKGGAS